MTTSLVFVADAVLGEPLADDSGLYAPSTAALFEQPLRAAPYKRALMRLGKRAYMRLGKRTAMGQQLDKRARLRLG